MYSKHFNLNENPFSIAPDPRYLYMSSKHQEALAHLMYGLKTDGGFVLLTGEVGTGKTTVCRCLLEQLPENLNVAFVLNPKLSSAELLATVCDELGIEYQADHRRIKELVDNINQYLLESHANGHKTVLIIDEAQNLSSEVLEQVRLLTNLETNKRKLLQIIMLGQPELRDQLARPELRQLAQRITARYHLGPLGRNEIAPYIKHRLGVAGHHKKLFPDKVINQIYRLTNGIPRLINVICDRALLGTYVEGREKVNHITLKKAANEVFGEPEGSSKAIMWLIITLFVISLGGIIFFIAGRNPLAKLSPTINQSVVESATKAEAIAKIESVNNKNNETILAWPEDIPHAKSRDMAFSTIFSSWGKVYQSDLDSSPCEQIKSQGLICLDRQGSLGSLRHLNRPAVLQMVGQQGHKFYAPLIKLTDNKATLLINSEEITVSNITLSERWFGSYTILWQPPPGYSRPIKPNGKGQDVEWLSAQIENVTGLQAASKDLAQMVTNFQKSEGLIADGIAGPETLIHLNSSAGYTGPTLVEN